VGSLPRDIQCAMSGRRLGWATGFVAIALLAAWWFIRAPARYLEIGPAVDLGGVAESILAVEAPAGALGRALELLPVPTQTGILALSPDGATPLYYAMYEGPLLRDAAVGIPGKDHLYVASFDREQHGLIRLRYPEIK